MSRLTLIITLSSIACLSLAQSSRTLVSYSIQELTPANGMSQSGAFSINDFGDVAGFSLPPIADFNSMATIWHNGVATALGRAQGGLYSYAEGINNSGRVCGEADDGDYRPLACVFVDGSAEIIDTGGNNSRGAFVATNGTIVGNYARGFGSTWLPALWTEDPNHLGRYDQEFLPTFTDPTGAESYNYLNGANNALQAVGQVSCTLWSSRGGFWNNDATHILTLLEPLPNEWDSYAFGINDLGRVVGVSDVGTFSTTPVTWSPTNHTIQPLPLFPGELHGWATAINCAGVIIGHHGNDQRPAVWVNGTIYDLQSRLSSGRVGWTLQTVSDVNERGQIVGTGMHYGVQRGFVLTPHPRTTAAQNRG